MWYLAICRLEYRIKSVADNAPPSGLRQRRREAIHIMIHRCYSLVGESRKIKKTSWLPQSHVLRVVSLRKTGRLAVSRTLVQIRRVRFNKLLSIENPHRRRSSSFLIFFRFVYTHIIMTVIIIYDGNSIT